MVAEASQISDILSFFAIPLVQWPTLSTGACKGAYNYTLSHARYFRDGNRANSPEIFR